MVTRINKIFTNLGDKKIKWDLVTIQSNNLSNKLIFSHAAESERKKPPVAFVTTTHLRLTKRRDRPGQAHAHPGPQERQREWRPMKTQTPARKTPPASSSTGDATRRRLIPAVGDAPCGPVPLPDRSRSPQPQSSTSLQFPEKPRSNDIVPPRPNRGTCVLCPCAPGEGLSHRWKLHRGTEGLVL